MTDLRTAVQDARKRLEAKAIDATTNDADGAYMDAAKCLDQILAEHPSAPQPAVDQCLRDALEKICDDYIAIDIELLRETLAAHPVEPAPPRPVVDREAVYEAISLAITPEVGGDPGASVARRARNATGAVLALLNGSAK